MATGNAKQKLTKQLGSDNADAIEAFVDERLEQGLREHSERFEEMRREIVELREQVGDVPDLRARVNAAAAALRGDIQEHNTRIERHNAGQQVASDELVREEQQLSETRGVVDDVRGEHEARLRDIEAILVINHEGDRPASRLDAIETRLSGVESSLEGTSTVAARAFALAQASVMTSNLLRRAATVAVAVFLVVFALYCLIVLTSSVDWRWRDAFGWSGIWAGLAGCLVYLFSHEREERRTSGAAQAEVEGSSSSNRSNRDNNSNRDAGLDIVRSERSSTDSQRERSVSRETRSDASASASAR